MVMKPNPFAELETRDETINSLTDHFLHITGLERAEFFTGRTEPVFRARASMMWIMRKKLDMPFTAIGNVFGKDHTTIISACHRIDMLRGQSPRLRTIINEIIEKQGL
jgi:hypothetical protein